MQEMLVVAVGMDLRAALPVLLLQETSPQHRVLPVWVGVAEANAIELERQHVTAPRPPTHQLICQVIGSLGRRLDHVCISEVRDRVFYAQLVFDGETAVSARPSDAVAVALHLGVPIHAADEVLDQAALADVEVVDTSPAGEGGDGPSARSPVDENTELERLRRFLDKATPDDFDTKN
ncbi:MAG: bifunctional nuclease family protein [Pseudonocardia sp.]|nr:bifunctional nuclease family protein [Pseudonocardia sp.]